MVKSILSHSQQATPSSPESDVPRDAHDGAAGVSGTSCAQEPSHARGCSASSLRRSTEKKKFVGRSPAKLKINRWVCQQYAQLFELQRCSEWVFVLEAETCSTIESLLEHKCDTGRVVVANPNDSVRSAIHSEFPDVNLFPMTSHDFFSAMRESGNSCRSALSQRGWNGCFGMIWLDYCGTFSSIAGRKRQKDIQNIFESGLLCNGSYAGILMLTLSLRGSPQIYEHDVVDSVVAFVTQVAERNAIKVTQNGTCCYKVSCRMYTLSFYARKKEDNDRRTAVEERDSNQRLYLRPENDSQISFFPGTWELLATRDKPLPAGIAMHCTSKLVFKLLMTALQGPMHCCIQESKLFYVSMELCQEDSFKTLLLLVGDPLDQNLADRLISSLSLQVRDRVCLRGEDFREIVCRAADQPEEFADLHKNPFDFVWLGYESYKSFSARDLQHCYTWKDINDLFNHGILSCFHGHECLVGICVNHASNGECWQGSCIDWIVLGFQQVANKYGCEATTLAVVQAKKLRLVGSKRRADRREIYVAIIPVWMIINPLSTSSIRSERLRSRTGRYNLAGIWIERRWNIEGDVTSNMLVGASQVKLQLNPESAVLATVELPNLKLESSEVPYTEAIGLPPGGAWRTAQAQAGSAGRLTGPQALGLLDHTLTAQRLSTVLTASSAVTVCTIGPGRVIGQPGRAAATVPLSPARDTARSFGRGLTVTVS
eukprot:768710-Hanusia_phi.AAC.2